MEFKKTFLVCGILLTGHPLIRTNFTCYRVHYFIMLFGIPLLSLLFLHVIRSENALEWVKNWQ